MAKQRLHIDFVALDAKRASGEKVCPTNSAASDAFASKNKAKRTPAS